MARKIFSGILIVLGAVFLVLSALGIVATWYYNEPLTYEAVANAWQRGIKRSKVRHFKLRDIRARALTDKDAAEGRRAANTMGAHSTEGQTADYIRHKTTRKTGATR